MHSLARNIVLVLLLIAVLVTTASAQERPPVSPPPTAPPTAPPATRAPLKVSEQDRCAWERYEYLRLLAEARLKITILEHRVQVLEYDAQLRAELATVDARFRAVYQHGINDLTYQDGVFRPKEKTAAAGATPPAPGGR